MAMQKNTIIFLLMFLMGFNISKAVNAEQEQTTLDSVVSEYNNGLISINSTGIALENVLRDIGERTNIQFELQGDYTNEVNLKIVSSPLENVIRHLVHDQNFVIVYASNINEDYRPIEKIYVFNHTLASPHKIDLIPSDILAELDLVAQLSTFPNDEAAPALAKKLTEKKSHLVTQFVIESLLDIGGDLAANALAEGLVDHRGQMRMDIVYALGQLDSAKAGQILAQVMFGDADPQLRIAAVEQLARFTTESTQAFLDAASQDKDERVQFEANYALESWKFDRTSPF